MPLIREALRNCPVGPCCPCPPCPREAAPAELPAVIPVGFPEEFRALPLAPKPVPPTRITPTFLPTIRPELVRAITVAPPPLPGRRIIPREMFPDIYRYWAMRAPIRPRPPTPTGLLFAPGRYRLPIPEMVPEPFVSLAPSPVTITPFIRPGVPAPLERIFDFPLPSPEDIIPGAIRFVEPEPVPLPTPTVKVTPAGEVTIEPAPIGPELLPPAEPVTPLLAPTPTPRITECPLCYEYDPMDGRCYPHSKLDVYDPNIQPPPVVLAGLGQNGRTRWYGILALTGIAGAAVWATIREQRRI